MHACVRYSPSPASLHVVSVALTSAVSSKACNGSWSCHATTAHSMGYSPPICTGLGSVSHWQAAVARYCAGVTFQDNWPGQEMVPRRTSPKRYSCRPQAPTAFMTEALWMTCTGMLRCFARSHRSECVVALRAPARRSTHGSTRSGRGRQPAGNHEVASSPPAANSCQPGADQERIEADRQPAVGSQATRSRPAVNHDRRQRGAGMGS
jgi:hypothetical protein